MTIDPLIVVGAFTAVGGLLLAIIRMFMTGAIHPRSTVPREDYDASLAVIASYAAQKATDTDAQKGMAEALKNMAATIDRVLPRNGAK